jgi:hypothetical protein
MSDSQRNTCVWSPGRLVYILVNLLVAYCYIVTTEATKELSMIINAVTTKKSFCNKLLITFAILLGGLTIQSSSASVFSAQKTGCPISWSVVFNVPPSGPPGSAICTVTYANCASIPYDLADNLTEEQYNANLPSYQKECEKLSTQPPPGS